MSNNPFVPPAAGGLPLAALDSATEGANALDAWAADPHGRNFLAHALVQLARDGWLRPEAGEGFEPVRERDDVPEPQEPAATPAVPVPPTTHAGDRAALRDRIAAALYERERPPRDRHWPDVYAADREVFEAMAAAVLAVLPEPSETHRLALSEALGLGTGAPWDAIHERVQELRRMADEAQQQPEAQPTPCSQPNPCEDGELCATHEERQAHAEGEHEFCGVTCEVAMPTELMRNSLIAWAPPGGRGILAELERRAAAGQVATVVRPVADAPCPGFPDRCPNPVMVNPDPPAHHGGIRCGCAAEAPQ